MLKQVLKFVTILHGVVNYNLIVLMKRYILKTHWEQELWLRVFLTSLLDADESSALLTESFKFRRKKKVSLCTFDGKIFGPQWLSGGF